MKNWSCALSRGDMKSNPGKIKHQAYENSYVIFNIDIGKIRRQAYENSYVISNIDIEKIRHQAYENAYVISNIDIGKIRRQAYENAYVISIIDVSKIKHQAYENSKGLLNTKLPLMNSCTKVWILKEVPSEKCNSEQLHFFLHKKVPVLMNHNI